MSGKRIARNRGPLFFAAAAAVAGLSAANVFGQAVVDYTSGSVTQNFSTLSGTGDAGATGANGTVDIANSAFGSGGSAMAGWYYYAQTKNVYVVDTNGQTGSASTGGLYAYGTGGAVSAMGLQTTSGSGNETIALELVNTSGSTLNSFNVSFDDATYHYGSTAGASKTLNFDYDVTSAGAANPSVIPTTGLSTTGLNYTATNPTPDTYSSNGEYEPGANLTAESATIFGSGGLNWQNNDVLWLEWVISTSSAQSPGIGLSNFSFSASSASTPSVTWATNTGAWDTSHTNWTGNATTYADGDAVTFASSLIASSTVTVQGAGVSPSSMTINNTTGFKYTFAGGSINGSGGLTNTAGTTELAAANSYSGGTTINGGTLIADGDQTLGSATGAITLGGGGTLQAGAAIGSAATPSQRSITVNPGGGTFNTNGFNSVTSGGASINDSFTVAGSGGLEIDGPMTFTANGALNIHSGATVTIGNSGTISQINSSNYDGTLLVTGTPRLNVGDPTGSAAVISSNLGTGKIEIANGGTTQSVTTTGTTMVTYTTYDTGVAITNAASNSGGEINVPIMLNSGGQAFTAANVANADPTCVGNFTVTFGGTTSGDGLVINGVISGNSDVNFANAQNDAGGGAGSLVLGAAETYTGTTLVNTAGTVLLDVPDTLPTTTDVIFGTVDTAEGHGTTIDLEGAVQQWDSLSSGEFGKSSDELITNYGSNPATLIIGGNPNAVTPSNKFKGTISDGVGGVAFVMDGPNTIGLSGTNTYSLGTTLSGGTLQSSNDTNLGNPNSTVTFNGGTLGVTGTITSPYLTSRPITVTANGGTIDVESTTSYTLSNSPAINWGGTLTFTDAGAAAISQSGGTISVSPGASLGVAAGANLTVNGTTDPFTDTSNSSNHVAVVNNGSLTVAQVNSSIASINGAGTLTVGDGVNSNTLQIAQGSNSAGNTVGSLSILGNSTLDITNNTLIINYGSGSDPINSIAALIAQGYNNGTWTGAGITSTTAQSNAGSYGIGYADYSPTYNPAGLSSGQLEITYTLLGDANLDHKVNGADFTLMAANFNDSVTNGWDLGDFNYSNSVNGDDFVLLAENFNDFASQSAVSAADLAALDAFAAANGISLTSVPEPASMGLLAMGAIGLLHRRRRRQSLFS